MWQDYWLQFATSSAHCLMVLIAEILTNNGTIKKFNYLLLYQHQDIKSRLVASGSFQNCNNQIYSISDLQCTRFCFWGLYYFALQFKKDIYIRMVAICVKHIGFKYQLLRILLLPERWKILIWNITAWFLNDLLFSAANYRFQ